MVAKGLYDLMYRFWAPWDSVGVRRDLVDFLDEYGVEPIQFPRVVDLGCGTGANVVYLAGLDFDVWGVDFSEVALRKAKLRAAEAGVDPGLVSGDLTAPRIEGLEGPFDLLIDFGTLDDLRGEARRLMADTITRLSRPGSMLLEYCFFGARDELPWFGMGGSKLSHIAPGELEDLFGDHWSVTRWRDYPDWRTATFVLTRL